MTPTATLRSLELLHAVLRRDEAAALRELDAAQSALAAASAAQRASAADRQRALEALGRAEQNERATAVGVRAAAALAEGTVHAASCRIASNTAAVGLAEARATRDRWLAAVAAARSAYKLVAGRRQSLERELQELRESIQRSSDELRDEAAQEAVHDARQSVHGRRSG